MDTIPGIDRIAAWTVLAEIGTDMSVFADARHLASWAALCPGNRESGGKRISGKTRKGNRYVRRALCQSAWAASRTKDTHLTALYRRIRSRRGEQKAIMAVAHQLLTLIAVQPVRERQSRAVPSRCENRVAERAVDAPSCLGPISLEPSLGGRPESTREVPGRNSTVKLAAP